MLDNIAGQQSFTWLVCGVARAFVQGLLVVHKLTSDRQVVLPPNC